MSFQFGKRSIKRLEGVHPDLVKVCHRALEMSPIDFSIIEGMRTLKRQKALLAKGADPTVKADSGATALMLAEKQGHAAVVALLQAATAP